MRCSEAEWPIFGSEGRQTHKRNPAPTWQKNPNEAPHWFHRRSCTTVGLAFRQLNLPNTFRFSPGRCHVQRDFFGAGLDQITLVPFEFASQHVVRLAVWDAFPADRPRVSLQLVRLFWSSDVILLPMRSGKPRCRLVIRHGLS